MNFVSQEQQWLPLASTLVELMAAIAVAYHCLWALSDIVQRRCSDQARLRIARGVLLALEFSLADSLLKTIGLRTWLQIRLFAIIYLLRQLVRQVFL
jgi:uncharacterized membrane protein